MSDEARYVLDPGPHTRDLNPQAEQMADESMVRTLSAQAEAIWPQEKPLFARYGVDGAARILDAGCGTGEITWRLAELFSAAELLGADILEESLAIARKRVAPPPVAARVRFERRSIFSLDLPDRAFDLVVCRHVLQAIPHADRAIAELVRVARPGGHIHLVAEDYGMIHFPAGRVDPSEFFPSAPRQLGAATGTDLLIGRHARGIMQRLGLRDITVDYVVVDTLRVPRETFAAIWEAWRDGYVDVLGRHTRFSRAQATAYFDEMIAAIRDPERYAVWMVPVVAARIP
jgi:ubiquinone/menaquinone biosynthesis C-methylase UbiE